MGFRFRRSVRLFPGVRLNFSASGISTTVGVRGASFNVSRRGTYATVGLPGTGLSYRTPISPVHRAPVAIPAPVEFQPHVLPVTIPEPVAEGEIRSADIEVLTSPGLGELKKLINEARVRRQVLGGDIAAAQATLAGAERRLRVAQMPIVRLFTRSRVDGLARKAFDANLAVNAAQDQLDGCVINIDFGFSDNTLAKYGALLRCYDLLRGCASIWDITASVAINRFKERTTATQAITRKPVRFDFSQSDIVASKYQALRLANVNGQDVHIYPGFVMLRNDAQDFALIDVRELSAAYGDSRFIEEDSVPSDAETVGQTWKKANKNGSPDRRFNNNYQIPIVRYGELSFSSATGLLEVYQISKWQNARNFAAAMSDYQAALAGDARSPPGTAPEDAAEIAPGAASHDDPLPEFIPPKLPTGIIADWLALAILFAGLVFVAFQAPSWLDRLHQAETSHSPSSDEVVAPHAIASAPIVEFVYAINAKSNIRALPSATGHVLGKAIKGHGYVVFGRQEGWIRIGDDAPVGWIKANLVRASP